MINKKLGLIIIASVWAICLTFVACSEFGLIGKRTDPAETEVTLSAALAISADGWVSSSAFPGLPETEDPTFCLIFEEGGTSVIVGAPNASNTPTRLLRYTIDSSAAPVKLTRDTEVGTYFTDAPATLYLKAALSTSDATYKITLSETSSFSDPLVFSCKAPEN